MHAHRIAHRGQQGDDFKAITLPPTTVTLHANTVTPAPKTVTPAANTVTLISKTVTPAPDTVTPDLIRGPFPRHRRKQLLVNLVQRKFTHLHQQKLLRVGLQDLATQLAANAAPSPGHQHGFAVGVQVEQQAIGLDRLTAQQVVNVQLAHITQAHLAGGNVAQAWQGSHRHLVGFECIQYFIAALARHTGQGQQHIGDRRATQYLGQVFWVVNRQTIEHMTVQTVVIVQEAHHPNLGATGHGRGQLSPCTARTVDECLRQSRRAQLLVIQPT